MPPPADARSPRSTRRDPWWLVGLAAALLATRIVLGIMDARQPAERPERVHWVPAEHAEQIARLSGKPILYDFSAEWCAPCHAMQQEVFADASQAARIERLVVPVRVVDRTREDGRNRPIVDSLQRVLNVEAFPTLVLVANGREIDRQEGFSGAEALTRWLSRATAQARRS